MNNLEFYFNKFKKNEKIFQKLILYGYKNKFLRTKLIKLISKNFLCLKKKIKYCKCISCKNINNHPDLYYLDFSYKFLKNFNKLLLIIKSKVIISKKKIIIINGLETLSFEEIKIVLNKLYYIELKTKILINFNFHYFNINFFNDFLKIFIKNFLKKKKYNYKIIFKKLIKIIYNPLHYTKKNIYFKKLYIVFNLIKKLLYDILIINLKLKPQFFIFLNFYKKIIFKINVFKILNIINIIIKYDCFNFKNLNKFLFFNSIFYKLKKIINLKKIYDKINF